MRMSIQRLLFVALIVFPCTSTGLLGEEIVTQEMIDGAKKDYQEVREKFNAAKEKFEYVHKNLNDFKDAVTKWRNALRRATQDAAIEDLDNVLKGITNDSLSKIAEKFKSSGDGKLAEIWNKAVDDFTESATERAQPWIKNFAKGLDKRKQDNHYRIVVHSFTLMLHGSSENTSPSIPAIAMM